jgi:redox-sensitive bicupin YhaK (pirin superfamily)
MTIEMILRPHEKDLGGFVVRRSLPSAQRQSIGPFLFFDHFGPVSFNPPHDHDVRPHPHIGLATVTYWQCAAHRAWGYQLDDLWSRHRAFRALARRSA